MNLEADVPSQTSDVPNPQTESHPSFIMPKTLAKNPALAAAEIFAGDTLFEEVMKEIKKERKRQKRREGRGSAK